MHLYDDFQYVLLTTENHELIKAPFEHISLHTFEFTSCAYNDDCMT